MVKITKYLFDIFQCLQLDEELSHTNEFINNQYKALVQLMRYINFPITLRLYGTSEPRI